MLDHETNAYLCEVARGKPMHALLKRYWLPAALSSDVPEPNSEPVRITLLSQNYVMFRDGAGNVGVPDENCCHRGASLALDAVVRARSALIRNARRVQLGEDPAGVDLEQVPAAGQGFVSPDSPWQSWFSP
jgi:hypothetical protein